MEIDRERLDSAVRLGIVTREQAEALWRELGGSPPPTETHRRAPALSVRAIGLASAAVLAAGLAVAAAATVVVLAWERSGPSGGLAATAALAAALAGAARALVRRSEGAAAVLAAAAVALVPLAAHGLLHVAGVVDAGPSADAGALLGSHAFLCCAAGAGAAALALAWLRLPPLAAVAVAAAWALAQAAAPVALGPDPTWSQRALLSALVGALALGTGLALDRRTVRDLASWLYLAGLVALWGGLTTYRSSGELSIALHASLDVALLLYGLVLERRTFAVFGAVGLAGAVGRLADRRFEPWAFPLVLAAVALALAAGGLAWERHARRWSRALVGLTPTPLRRLLPPGVGR